MHVMGQPIDARLRLRLVGVTNMNVLQDDLTRVYRICCLYLRAYKSIVLPLPFMGSKTTICVDVTAKVPGLFVKSSYKYPLSDVKGKLTIKSATKCRAFYLVVWTYPMVYSLYSPFPENEVALYTMLSLYGSNIMCRIVSDGLTDRINWMSPPAALVEKISGLKVRIMKYSLSKRTNISVYRHDLLILILLYVSFFYLFITCFDVYRRRVLLRMNIRA